MDTAFPAADAALWLFGRPYLRPATADQGTDQRISALAAGTEPVFVLFRQKRPSLRKIQLMSY